MPRFVLLFHDCPPGYQRPSHWDLMLEQGQSLRTWALRQLPCEWQIDDASVDEPIRPVEAEQLGDHRLAYLDYEGPVSGERGKVTRVDAGTYETVDESPDAWQIALSGERIRGRITLSRGTSDSSHWTLATSPAC